MNWDKGKEEFTWGLQGQAERTAWARVQTVKNMPWSHQLVIEYALHIGWYGEDMKLYSVKGLVPQLEHMIIWGITLIKFHFNSRTIDCWTTQVWTAWIHLYMEFFNKYCKCISSYDFLNIFSLDYFIVRIQYTKYNTYTKYVLINYIIDKVLIA